MDPAPASDSSGQWLPLVYEELRRLAATRVAGSGGNATLQPTALVHEAWLRLGPGRQWRDRAHFFAAAAEAMRHILIDRARQRQTRRHGGGAQRVTFDEINLPTDEAHDDQLLAVNAALEKFAVEDPAKAELVKLRYFVGLTNEEAAQALGISVPTAKRWWAYARVWLLRNIREA